MSKNRDKPKFVIDFPELAKQWHPTKNGDFKPENTSMWSKKKVWWKCDRGPDHVWETTVEARTYKRTRCPFCRGLKPSVTNSLASIHPGLAKQWHPTKNQELKPNMVITGSHKSVWWSCDEGPDHIWKTEIRNRTGKRKTGCPFCEGKKLSITNSLSTVFPELIDEWFQEKNGKITPEMVKFNTSKAYWWSCDKGPDHIWKTKVGHRTGKTKSGCPFCQNLKLSVTNSLASCYSELAKEWHQERNGDTTPDKVVAGSGQLYWWKCDKGPDHVWKATPNTRTNQKRGCPFCSGQKVSVTNSLASCYPELAKEWRQEKNGEITPDKITAKSSKYFWWKCDKGSDHVWKATLANRTRSSGGGCPFCAGQKVSVTNSLASLHPDLAKEWYQEKNGEITPDKVVVGSGKLFWWKCDKGPDHEWKTSLSNRIRSSGGGCPFCAGQKVSVTNSLASLYPDLAKEWYQEKNGKITPDKVVAGSAKRYWWKCDKDPDHEWKTSPHNRTSRRATGCPYCNLGDVELIGYLWERICHRIAQQLLKEEKWFW